MIISAVVCMYGIICALLDLIRDIRDPEKPETLEQLNVVYESGVTVEPLTSDTCLVRIEFTPTVPHCTLATLIGWFFYLFCVSDFSISGLCLFCKLLQGMDS